MYPRRKSFIPLILFILIHMGIFAQERPIIQPDHAQSAWREDLQVLANQMPRRHPNLFWRLPQAEFEQMVADLDAEIPYLTDNQIKLGLMKIVAQIDGHTTIFPFEPEVSFHLYPLRLYKFSDGIFVVDAPPEYAEAVGKRLVSIGNTDAQTVYDLVYPYVSFDSDMTKQLSVPQYMVIPEALEALGIISDVNNPNIIVQDAKGETITLNPPIITIQEFRFFLIIFTGLPQRPEPLYLSKRADEFFWFTYLDDSRTLYIQYNRVARQDLDGQTITNFAGELTDAMAANNVERVVLDVRHNPGGDNTTYFPLMRFLTTSTFAHQPGQFYIITGRQTFSAAVNFVTELEGKTDAIFVGEATGGSPNLYGDTRPIRLPNSRINVHVSSRYWQKSTADDIRDAIAPDIPALLSSADYFEGRDPALEAILSSQ